jgi:Predicted membrane protein, putative toxin regulator
MAGNNKKRQSFSISGYIITTLNGMAYGFFCSLIVGVILSQFGNFFKISEFIYWGEVAKNLMGPAIGIGIAYSIHATGISLIVALIAGAIGAGTFSGGMINTGDPVCAYLAVLIAVEVAKMVQGKTPVDILIVPLITIITSGIVVKFVGPYVGNGINYIGGLINQATVMQPLIMGLLVAVLMGMALTSPISSAAIAIILGLDGITAGVAVAGCCTQMLGFMVMSIEDNDIGDVIAIGIGTSMLQFKNIVRRPIIWLPPIIASAIVGMIASVVVKLEATPMGAGMGTAGFVGPLTIIEVMGNDYWIPMLIVVVVLPIVITYFIYHVFRRLNWIRKGDLKITRL